MKNIFLRKPEIPPSKPSRSHRPTDAYNVWIPPEASRVPTPGPSARASSNAGPSHAQESYRGTGRTLPRPEPPSSNSYKYAGGQTTKTGFSYSNHAPQPVPVQPIPIQPYGQYYLSNPPTSSLERPESRNGYTTYVPTHFQYPHFPGVPVPQPTQSEYRRAKEEKRRARESSARPSPKKHREKEATTSSSRAPHLATSTSSIRLTPDELEPRHRKRDAGEVRTRKDSRTKEEDQIRDPAKKREKESRRKSKVDGRMDEGESSDGSVQRPLTAGHHLRHTDGKKLQPSDPAARPRAAKPPADNYSAPQLSNTIPVQLPAPSQRPNQTAPAPESDTERGGTLVSNPELRNGPSHSACRRVAGEVSSEPLVSQAGPSKHQRKA
ncbi:unnamed protein product [Mycena citricolor]|uniref:Uncharacterized protein n=1 Tax=Mycena citricolor TaxID=2018698 RepID=A0AAD2HW81_9AGAR|nr:unnamed protein product [Mycena citricolor]